MILQLVTEREQAKQKQAEQEAAAKKAKQVRPKDIAPKVYRAGVGKYINISAQ